MSIPLLKIELKSNYKILLLFMGIITLYTSVITAMYDPELGAGINEMAESMPQLFAAFGMEQPGTTLLEFLNNYLYGFILLVIPFIYTALMCYKLMAKYIEKGSMAYLLNTHYSRIRIAVTQFVVLVTGLCFLLIYAAALIMLMSEIMYGGELEIPQFLYLHLGLLILELFLAAFCFLFASMFDELKYSIGLGAGLGMIFFLMQMLSQVGEETEILKYVTPLTLFMPEGLIAYEQEAAAGLGILFGASALCLAVGIMKFSRRDLSL